MHSEIFQCGSDTKNSNEITISIQNSVSLKFPFFPEIYIYFHRIFIVFPPLLFRKTNHPANSVRKSIKFLFFFQNMMSLLLNILFSGFCFSIRNILLSSVARELEEKNRVFFFREV